MRRLLEKLIIVSLCLLNSYYINPDLNLVFYLLISVIFSTSLDLAKSRKFRALVSILFIGLSVYDPAFINYLPLILYNLYLDYKFYIIFTIPIFFISFSLLNLIVAFISVYMSITADSYKLFVDDNIIMRDNLKEDALYLRKYNEQLKVDREKISILPYYRREIESLGDCMIPSVTLLVAVFYKWKL